MIFLVTTRCDMGCTHCIGNHTVNGEDMTIEEFKYGLEQIYPYTPLIILSGGEPLMHPDIMEFINIALSYRDKQVMVTTNGKYLSKYEYQFKKLLNKYKDRLFLQVTNIKGYYPERIDESVVRRLGFDVSHELWSMIAIGRAKINNLKPFGYKLTACANVILVANQAMNFADTVYKLIRANKYCSFLIIPNLDLYMSECRQVKLTNLHNPNWEDTAFNKLLFSNQLPDSNVICEKCGYCNDKVFEIIRNGFCMSKDLPIKYVNM